MRSDAARRRRSPSELRFFTSIWGRKSLFYYPANSSCWRGEKGSLLPLYKGERYDFTAPPAAAAGGRKKGLFRPCRGAKDTTLPGRQQQLLVGEKKGLLCPPTKDMRFMARFWRCLLRSPKYFARARGTLRRAQTLRVRSRLNS
jgi:hypothetical protein